MLPWNGTIFTKSWKGRYFDQLLHIKQTKLEVKKKLKNLKKMFVQSK